MDHLEKIEELVCSAQVELEGNNCIEVHGILNRIIDVCSMESRKEVNN